MIGIDERGRGVGVGFAVLGSGVAWTGHLLLTWGISEFACTAGVEGRIGGIDVVTAALLAVSAGAFALSVVSTGYAILLERRVGPPQAGQHPVSSLARVGWVLGALFTATIVAQTLPIAWFVGGC